MVENGAEKPRAKRKATKGPPGAPRPRGDFEVEIKLPCDDVACLTEAGLEVEQVETRHFEDNWIYKLPDGKLRKGQYLRIRYIGNGDGAGKRHEGVLTYKGKSRRESAASKGKGKGKKVREELETSIGQPNKVVKIFKRLGLQRSFRYQKYRSVYRVTLDDGRSLLAMFDETPIGNFLELEGDPEVIEAVARRLGYKVKDYVTDSYVELQVAWCAARGVALTDMMIERKKPAESGKRPPGAPAKTARAQKAAARAPKKAAKSQKKK